MHPRGSVVALLLALFIAPPALAEPGGISVSPIRVDLDANRRSGALTLHNGSERRYRFQVDVLRWTQTPQGEDLYAPADGVIANPPLFELAPQAQQVVRVGLLGAVPASVEASYRIYFNEIEQPQPTAGTGLNVLLRLGVPMFVAPLAAAQHRLEWSARMDGNRVLLRADNRGNVHERRAQLRVTDAARGSALHEDSGFRDILPGSSWQWTLPAGTAVPAQLKIEANTHESHDTVVVRVDRP
ncbi:fimbria/pilus periplasmic chaperone [Fontimonas sp. SYSU GA230001]|uniref:fimbrial biogenesis chaperone n=1 Tax=Fontimonas sp. SYSU GA230001 TaxID=3142450 RepID=UPI0032B5B260